MSFWKKVGESIKKTAKTIGEEIKTRQEISKTKRRILNKFEMKDLKRICKDYGIGEPSKYEEDFITGERRKRTVTREHYINRIMSRLSLEQIKNFADKHRIDTWDIVKEEKKPIRRSEEIKEQPKEKKVTKIEIKRQSEFDSILEDIENEFEPEECRNEEDFEKQLVQYLKYKLPNSVKRQVTTRKGTIDLVIDNKYAIELKIADNRSKLRDTKGQIHDYLKVFNELAVIILDVGKLRRSEIKEYVDDYQELGAKVIVLEGVLKRRKGKSRQISIRY